MLEPRDVQPAWRDHRKPVQPESFTEVTNILSDLIPSRLLKNSLGQNSSSLFVPEPEVHFVAAPT
jgi:hypothetical protein